MTTSVGTLYVVGTPIGNLEDMTFRAIKTLRTVDVIAAEDTRHTGKLLHHFEISTPQISYHDHNRVGRLPELIGRLHHGNSIALVTDAGMPGISDPGYELVQRCRVQGIKVVPIPGPSACVTALSAAGLASERFVFEGFLPTKRNVRFERLELLVNEPRTLIFYESPHRLERTLKDFQTVLGGDRPLVIARELTKVHEELWSGSLAEAVVHYGTHPPKGEFTLVIEGAQMEAPLLSEAALTTELTRLLRLGLSRSQASRKLAQQSSLPRRQIYQLALSIPNQE